MRGTFFIAGMACLLANVSLHEEEGVQEDGGEKCSEHGPHLQRGPHALAHWLIGLGEVEHEAAERRDGPIPLDRASHLQGCHQ